MIRNKLTFSKILERIITLTGIALITIDYNFIIAKTLEMFPVKNDFYII